MERGPRSTDCERLFELSDDCGAAADPERALVQRRLEEHLELCAPCRRAHGALERGRSLLRSFPPAGASPEFTSRVFRRIDLLERRRRRRRRACEVGAHAGALGLAAGVAFVLVYALLGGPIRGLRGGDSAAERGALPSISLVRPFAALGRGETSPLFTPSADLELEPSAGPPWSALLAPGSGRDAAPGGRPSSGRAALGGERRPGPVRPVLYAAPSWTFAAAPISLRFVSGPPGAPRP